MHVIPRLTCFPASGYLSPFLFTLFCDPSFSDEYQTKERITFNMLGSVSVLFCNFKICNKKQLFKRFALLLLAGKCGQNEPCQAAKKLTVADVSQDLNIF